MKPNISQKRHILKTITWRALGTIDTIILSWVVTGSLTLGLSIGGFELISKMVLYYIHERLWYRSDFGIERSEKDK